MAHEPILISKKTAAKLLGISPGMISKLRRQGVLEGVPIGARILFRREDIEKLALKPSQRKAFGRPCVESVQ